VGDALASSKRSGKSTGFWLALTAGGQRTRFPIEIAALWSGDVSCGCVAIRGSSPFIDCGLDARRTSHPVAVPRTAGTTIPHSQGHRAREGGSTLYVGISQPLFVTVRLPGSNGARLRPARAQGPEVRRLAAGGRWIRTIGPRHERADFCCGRRIAGPNGGAKKG
jgi:hypothetical protein